MVLGQKADESGNKRSGWRESAWVAHHRHHSWARGQGTPCQAVPLKPLTTRDGRFPKASGGRLPRQLRPRPGAPGRRTALPLAPDAQQCHRGENTVSSVQLPRKPCEEGAGGQDLAWAGKMPRLSARLFGDEDRLHLVLQPPADTGLKPQRPLAHSLWASWGPGERARTERGGKLRVLLMATLLEVGASKKRSVVSWNQQLWSLSKKIRDKC